jgi:hypothetical protein
MGQGLAYIRVSHPAPAVYLNDDIIFVILCYDVVAISRCGGGCDRREEQYYHGIVRS